MNEGPVHVLSDEECWDFLRSQELGRLAFHLVEQVQITPINYAVDPHGPSGPSLLFRTAEGDKLLGVVMNSDVAFEVDEWHDETARSVVVRGRARKLEEDEAHRAENLPLRPWVGTLKYNVVEIEPLEVTGRSFELSKPWTHIRP